MIKFGYCFVNLQVPRTPKQEKNERIRGYDNSQKKSRVPQT